MAQKIKRTRKLGEGPGRAEIELNLAKAKSEFDRAKKSLVKWQKELNKLNFKE